VEYWVEKSKGIDVSFCSPQPIILPIFHYSNIPGKVPEILYDQNVTRIFPRKVRALQKNL